MNWNCSREFWRNCFLYLISEIMISVFAQVLLSFSAVMNLLQDLSIMPWWFGSFCTLAEPANWCWQVAFYVSCSWIDKYFSFCWFFFVCLFILLLLLLISEFASLYFWRTMTFNFLDTKPIVIKSQCQIFCLGREAKIKWQSILVLKSFSSYSWKAIWLLSISPELPVLHK